MNTCPNTRKKAALTSRRVSPDIGQKKGLECDAGHPRPHSGENRRPQCNDQARDLSRHGSSGQIAPCNHDRRPQAENGIAENPAPPGCTTSRVPRKAIPRKTDLRARHGDMKDKGGQQNKQNWRELDEPRELGDRHMGQADSIGHDTDHFEGAAQKDALIKNVAHLSQFAVHRQKQKRPENGKETAQEYGLEWRQMFGRELKQSIAGREGCGGGNHEQDAAFIDGQGTHDRDPVELVSSAHAPATFDT